MLVPDECKRALAYLTNPEVRAAAGIDMDNDYVFANSSKFPSIENT
jgi:hypothetical protein